MHISLRAPALLLERHVLTLGGFLTGFLISFFFIELQRGDVRGRWEPLSDQETAEGGFFGHHAAQGQGCSSGEPPKPDQLNPIARVFVFVQ